MNCLATPDRKPKTGARIVPVRLRTKPLAKSPGSPPFWPIALAPLALAVQQTADHIIITDAQGRIQYVNPAFERFTGFTKEEVIGRTPRLLKSGHHDLKFFRELWKTLLSGNVFRAVFTNKKKDGQIYGEEKTIAPIKDERGVITHFVSTGRDITERRQIEEERESHIRELRRAVAEVEALRGLLPICAWCKRVRDEHDRWEQIEAYLSRHSHLKFTHCICPGCAEKVKLEAQAL